MPRSFLGKWCRLLGQEIARREIGPLALRRQLIQGQWSIVFVDIKRARKLNFQFRQRDYATDVLSFLSHEPEELGELVVCPQVLKRQAKEHELTFNEELGYMALHGALHLLGYDHEKSRRAEKIMMDLQDDLFDVLCRKIKPGRKGVNRFRKG